MSTVPTLVHPRVAQRARELGSLLAAIVEFHLLYRQASPQESGGLPTAETLLEELATYHGLTKIDLQLSTGYPHERILQMTAHNRQDLQELMGIVLAKITCGNTHFDGLLGYSLLSGSSRTLDSSTTLDSIVIHKRARGRARTRPNTVSTHEAEQAFEMFWDLYDRKVGKPKAKALWMKLRRDEHEAIMEAAPAYVASTPDKKYRKHPETWLRNRGWEDEVILPTKPSQRDDADDWMVV